MITILCWVLDVVAASFDGIRDDGIAAPIHPHHVATIQGRDRRRVRRAATYVRRARSGTRNARQPYTSWIQTTDDAALFL